MAPPPLILQHSNSAPAPLQPVNGGNTCYLDSVLVALFADFDGCDGLLFSDSRQSLRTALRTTVNTLRRGEAISASVVNKLRDVLIAQADWPRGRGQHDAAELFSVLLDALHAPFVPMMRNLTHRGAPDISADHVPYTERLLWLNLYSASDNDVRNMIEHYFYGQVVHGLRRGTCPVGVDASVSRSLIPAYTPIRETGEMVSAMRCRFAFLTVPFAVSRFSPSGKEKDCSPVQLCTAIDATRYVNPFANGMIYTLMLRSVVCHLGATIRSGHYITYTYSPQVGWRRWDDLEGGSVPSCKGDVRSGAPENRKWADEISRNCYLAFYELVPGDGDFGGIDKCLLDEKRKQILIDSKLAAKSQEEEYILFGLREQALHAAGNELIDSISISDVDEGH